MARQRDTLRGPARVLVVARPPIAELIRLTLSHGTFTVQTTSDVARGEELSHSWKPHLLIVDIDLARGRPEQLIGEIIAARRLPTIVLTGRGDLRTKLDVFQRGADDFLDLPLNPDELVARALAVMRRTYGENVAMIPEIHVGEITIDLLNREVRSDGQRIGLTQIEQALLYLLMPNAGLDLGRDDIIDSLWGADYEAGSNLVDRHVRNLRVKLHDDWRRPRFIRTVPGKGYRFVAATSGGRSPS